MHSEGRVEDRVVQCAHFAEELWVKVTFVFAWSPTDRTAVRSIRTILPGGLKLVLDWQRKDMGVSSGRMTEVDMRGNNRENHRSYF
ncbi:hypothetical protein CesoFtcFv8_018429 [Champsocephalus esox]|uniref:Uncharacterized protein n=1 Tax=Champsocephalus esox TaxID=159716 RepID=A0AAN8BGP0_9TELE|nr:hypothetical protein CesoFtcFv8_018429 [Champsocephalus esox]